MQALPVLMVTQNAALWGQWQHIDQTHWQPVRGHTLQDLEGWRQQKRDMVILDAALPLAPDWENSEQWTQYFSHLRVLVLSTHPDDVTGQKILASGAYGYAHAYSPSSLLERMLHSIQDGSIWMGRTLLQQLLHDVRIRLPITPPEWAATLTPREQEVAQLVALGDSNQTIAEQLDISERTVRAHLSAIFEKLQVSDRLMLALRVHGIRR